VFATAHIGTYALAEYPKVVLAKRARETARARSRYEDRNPPATSSRRVKTLEVKTVLRHTPACAVVLLVLASACSSSEGADATPTGSSVAVADTTSTSSPVTVEPFPEQLPSQEIAAVIRGEVPEGFEAFNGSANGFTIALPATWLTIDLTVGDKDSIAAQLETIFPPESAETLSSNYVQFRKTAASGSGTVMAAFDPTGDPSLIVTVSPRESLDTLESEEEMIQDGIEYSGGSVQSVDRLELSGREASRIVTLFSLETNDVELVQYVVLGDDTTYNITFNSSEPGATDTLLSHIINTFTIADA
jgi:hypothetical protein